MNSVLSDPDQFPDDGRLSDILGDAWPAYQRFITTLKDEGLALQWAYYRDGKSWLAKVSHKKKTILWLSVGALWFQVCFYFNQTTAEGVHTLSLAPGVLSAFRETKSVGKLRPLVLRLGPQDNDFTDLLTLVRYKVALK